jgi:hypothetical protein
VLEPALLVAGAGAGPGSGGPGRGRGEPEHAPSGAGQVAVSEAQGDGFLWAKRGVVQAAEEGGQLRPGLGDRVQQRADLVRAGHDGGVEGRG